MILRSLFVVGCLEQKSMCRALSGGCVADGCIIIGSDFGSAFVQT